VRLRLHNDVEVLIRPIRRSDKPALAKGMEVLSPESVRRRFLTPKKGLTAGELRYLTEVDFVNHVALVAVRAHAPYEPVAVGRWVRSIRSPDTAEIAIVVRDELQGIGLGTALGTTLAWSARALGIRRFTATMLPENLAARALLRHLSAHLETRVDRGAYELAGDLAA
jgi:GNAT superfamily N-acetyltransferase